ncbi:hypothetical protein H9P43_001395 [Blastocladiella emersonii ATCC 22665]|nr:hypothetical protein H9P43_001395 [Blastocladiella emersonii ATCC 22665]
MGEALVPFDGPSKFHDPLRLVEFNPAMDVVAVAMESGIWVGRFAQWIMLWAHSFKPHHITAISWSHDGWQLVAVQHDLAALRDCVGQLEREYVSAAERLDSLIKAYDGILEQALDSDGRSAASDMMTAVLTGQITSALSEFTTDSVTLKHDDEADLPPIRPFSTSAVFRFLETVVGQRQYPLRTFLDPVPQRARAASLAQLAESLTAPMQLSSSDAASLPSLSLFTDQLVEGWTQLSSPFLSSTRSPLVSPLGARPAVIADTVLFAEGVDSDEVSCAMAESGDSGVLVSLSVSVWPDQVVMLELQPNLSREPGASIWFARGARLAPQHPIANADGSTSAWVCHRPLKTDTATSAPELVFSRAQGSQPGFGTAALPGAESWTVCADVHRRGAAPSLLSQLPSSPTPLPLTRWHTIASTAGAAEPPLAVWVGPARRVAAAGRGRVAQVFELPAETDELAVLLAAHCYATDSLRGPVLPATPA